MPYDPETGLVYQETTVSARRIRCNCTHATSCNGSKPNKSLSSKGQVLPLRDIALRRVLCNLKELDLDSLSTVPVSILELLWKNIKSSDLDSVKTWQLFAQTPLGTRRFGHTWWAELDRHCQMHKLPYLIDVAGVSDSWITNLTISSVDASTQDLVFLAKLRNLRNLHVYGNRRNAYQPFDDRIVKAWACAAREDNAFQRLAMIFLHGQRYITANAFQHLAAFSRLDTFCALGCGFRSVADVREVAIGLGWVSSSSGDFIRYTNSWTGNAPSEYPWTLLVDCYIRHRQGLIPVDVENVPVLDVQAARNTISQMFRPSDEMLCFERDWSIARVLTGKRKADDQEAVTMTTRPAPKMRKIKDGKVTALNAMLADF